MLSGLARLASGLTADAAKILLDQPNGGYDRLHTMLERTVKLPGTRTERGWLVAAAVLLKRLLFRERTQAGPLRDLAAEVADDTFVETCKRVVEPRAAEAAAPPVPRVPAAARVNAGLEGLANFIVPGLGRKEERR